MAAVVFLACGGLLFSQNAAPGPLDLTSEIQNIEAALRSGGLSAEDQRESFMRLARLRQLAGDLEGAAANWLSAAIVRPGAVDPVPLLYCAFALTAMGEWERAQAALAPLLAPSFASHEIVPRARFLDAFIRALAGDPSALAALAGNGANASGANLANMSEIYYVLWRTQSAGDPQGAELWRQRLAAEFPQSPEGRVAAAAPGQPQAIAARPSSMWLLMGAGQTPGFAALPSPPLSAPPPPPAARVQTGLFSQQANAQAQARSLQAAGFQAVLERREAGSGELWAVVVPSPADPNATVTALREAGFESFPVR